MAIKLNEPINTLACNYINSLENEDLIDLIHEDGYKFEDTQRYSKQIKKFCNNVIKEAGNETTHMFKQIYRHA